MRAQEIAEPNTILMATVGSTLHGLALDGTDDQDEMGVCIEPPEYVIGLHRFEQWVYRTQPEGSPSGPGDTDRTVYSLRKYARLALDGNPTILLLLYAPDRFVLSKTPIGEELQRLHWAFASRQAGARFLGYLTSQKQRLLGERGQKRVNRTALESKHGYDTKYAMHMVRLGYQGIEYLTTGRITLPTPESERITLMGIRRGEVELNDVLSLVGKLEAKLESLQATSPLPDKPYYATVEDFLLRSYQEWWHAQCAWDRGR